MLIFFFQAEDGIRDIGVTGVQTCALPISKGRFRMSPISHLRSFSKRPLVPVAAALPPNTPINPFESALTSKCRVLADNGRSSVPLSNAESTLTEEASATPLESALMKNGAGGPPHQIL